MPSRWGELARILKVLLFFVALPLFLAPSCKPHSSGKSAVVPPPPSGFTATTISTSRIDLSWTNVPAGVTAVEIWRSVNGGPFVLLVSLAPTAVAYSDTGLTPSTEYCYEIRSVGSVDGPFSSPPACASTVLPSSVPTTGGPPSNLMGHSMVYDNTGTNNRLIVFGGLNGTGVTNQVWVLDLASSTWSLAAPAGTAPPARMNHTAILDAANARMIVFGGYAGSLGTELDQVHSLDLSTPGFAWSAMTINAAPSTPFPRQGHSAILYPSAPTPVMVVFGGSGIDFSLPGPATFADVWTLTLPAPGTASDWSDITPAPGPQARAGHAAIYNGGGHMIVFGGNLAVEPTVSATNDTWSFDLVTPGWTTVAATGAPAARFGHSMILNGTRLVVFGGYAGSPLNSPQNDLWQLDLSSPAAWIDLPLGSTLPAARLGHAAVLNAASTMTLFGGGTAPLTPAFNDVWQFGM